MPFYKNILANWKKNPSSDGPEGRSSGAPPARNPTVVASNDHVSEDIEVPSTAPPFMAPFNQSSQMGSAPDTIPLPEVVADPLNDTQIANLPTHILNLGISDPNPSQESPTSSLDVGNIDNKVTYYPTAHLSNTDTMINMNPDLSDKGKAKAGFQMDFDGADALFGDSARFDNNTPYHEFQTIKSSNESISSRPNTISTYQSSLFSGMSNARTIESTTTAGSSLSYSKSGYNPPTFSSVAEDADSSSSVASSVASHAPGKAMKIVRPDDYKVDDTVPPAKGRNQSHLASFQQQRHIPTFSSGMAPHRSMPSFLYEEKESAILFEAAVGTPSVISTSPTSVKSVTGGRTASVYSGSSHRSSSVTSINSHQQKPTKQYKQKHQSQSQPQKHLQAQAQQQRSTISLPEALENLSRELTSINDQFNQGKVDISVAGPDVTHALKNFLQTSFVEDIEPNLDLVHKYPTLCNIIKIVLHFLDNLLNHPQHMGTKGQILRSFCLMGIKLKLLDETSNGALTYPRNFAVGSVAEFDSQAVVLHIMDSIASSESRQISDQEGSFIAPILRGLSPQFAVLTITFGFPEPNQDHYDMMISLNKLAPDIHLYCQKNHIAVCATTSTSSSRAYFKPPFREPLDSKCPPISLSLSAEDAQTTSGTLGGYIYPKIDPENKELAGHAQYTYAMTCAHVCMMANSESSDGYSPISVPSSVLINMFKRALEGEVKKYPPTSEIYRAYDGAVNDLNEKYPMSNADNGGLSLNRPKDSFGEVVWGERTVINGSISDVAIIRCAPDLTCRNYLGDDISFSEYNPALMFENLYVNHMERKMIPGTPVFKYGSTSKYTAGVFNGPKIVYWANGKIQSSEFVVRSASGPMFATGGDSGSWILHKRDLTSSSQTPSLSVLGMLHSYDGEHKEFGLFTPMTQILDRLAQVTGNKWGIVGVADNQDDDILVGGSESSGDDNGNQSE